MFWFKEFTGFQKAKFQFEFNFELGEFAASGYPGVKRVFESEVTRPGEGGRLPKGEKTNQRRESGRHESESIQNVNRRLACSR